MSADTTPISPGRFAAALEALPPAMLRLKVLEIRNSIAHLQYSNDQLRPFADGAAAAPGAPPGVPDRDCADAVRENEAVIDRMARRIALVRAEVDRRGLSWLQFQDAGAAGGEDDDDDATGGRGGDDGRRDRLHPAWTDGTFQTGSVSNGQVRLDAPPAAAAGPSSDAPQTSRPPRQAGGDPAAGGPPRDDGPGPDADGGVHL